MKILITLIIAVLLISCSVSPEPLRYGQDACFTCKMTLMDKKFGAELVTHKGKIYKFDDMNCMVNFYNSGVEPEDNIANRLVIDFGNPGVLVNAQEALYIKSDQIRSPMGGQVAAFSNPDQLNQSNKEWKGILLGWGEVVTTYK